MNIPHQEVEALLREASEEKIMPLWKNLNSDDVSEKTLDEIVTIADQSCELFLTERLPKLLAGSLVLGEESVHKDPTLMAGLQSDAPVWVIDPLDGTGNFVSGNPPIAIMVCLIHNGVTLGAWVLNPLEGTLTHAEKGGGAFEGDTRLHVTPSVQPLSNLCGALLTKFLPDHLRPTAEAAASYFLGTERTKCAGYDYNAFAKNDMQFLFYYRTLVWDHAPGILIAEEAGGFVRRLDGTSYTPVDTREGLLCASNCEMWETIQKTLVPTVHVVS